MEDNKIIHPHQHGFRKLHSTEYAALHITDYIKYKMDVGEIPINVYLDYSRAYDALVHSTLLHNMKHYGIETRSLFVRHEVCYFIWIEGLCMYMA